MLINPKLLYKVLYENEDGTKNAITLSKDVSLFSYIEIIYGQVNRYLMKSEKFPSDQRSVGLSLTNCSNNGTVLYVSNKNYAISGKTISVAATNRYIYYEVAANKILNYLHRDDIYIYKVLDYK